MAKAMHRRLTFLALIGSGCSTCGPGSLGDLPAETDGDAVSSEGDDEGGASATETGVDAPESEWVIVQTTAIKEVDVLLVIDDSESTPEFQSTLVANFPAFLNLLESPDVQADYRIAVTTTDVGLPVCDSVPESGAFVASSCHERIGDFVGDQGTDVSQSACLDNCPYESIEILPSATHVGDTSVPRPWIERIHGETNIGGDLTTVEAAQCMLPQGIDGCEFIAPLEAARRAIERAKTPGEPEYGFLRERAHLNIVVVTDGDDCSVPFDKRAIFLPPEECYDADGDGDETDDCTQVFWTDPEAESATPGVCWNAGVACTGADSQPDGSTTFESCIPADKGLDGEPADAEDAAILPVDNYAEWLAELDAEKAAFGARALLLGVAGVPNGSTTIPFATSTEPEINLEQGIGPSCTGGAAGPSGFPPVRLREVIASNFDKSLDETLVSVCADDYSPVFGPIAEAIRDQLKPACATRCAADVDPSTPALDFECEVRQTVPGPEPVVESVPQCLPNDEQPDDADVCWVPVTRGDDTMSEECIDEGWNLEVRIVRREGHPAWGGTMVEIACEWTDPVDGVCPGA